MNEMFSQGGKGSTGILTNKQAIARKFGVKQSEVVYFLAGVDLGGYKVIYDKKTQRAYSLPAGITTGTIAISLSEAAVLVHSKGSVDLGALALLREEFVTLTEDFTSGFTIRVKNELVSDSQSLYRWDGVLPKTVDAGGSVSSDGVGKGKWVETSTSNLSYLPKPITWAGFAGGADPTGNLDSSLALSAAYAAAESGYGLLIPKGVYKEGSQTKEIKSDSWWLSRDFGMGVGVTTECRKTPLLITVGNPDVPVLSSEHTRTGINITAVGRGGQHIDCIRATTINYSTDGKGNTAIYAAALSTPGALWTAALHGEIKHQGNSTIAVSAEAASYSNTGTFYGMVLNNTTSTAAEAHPSTGEPATLHPSATALYITGSNQRGEMGQWIRGIRFSPLSMRAAGTLVRDESACAQGWWSQSTSSKTNADIFLEGSAPQGIILQGNYSSGNAIRLKAGDGIAYEATGTIRTKYDNSATRWGIFNGSTEKVSFNTVTPGLYFNGIKVLGVQQPAIANATAGTEVATINAILSVMRINGTIATA